MNSEFPKNAGNINGNFSSLPGGRVQGSSVSANAYRTLARNQRGYAALIGVADPDLDSIAVGSAPATQVGLQYVSANFFEGLGIIPVLGRTFTEGEDAPGGQPAVVISNRFWVSQLGKTGDLSGLRLRINNVPVHVIGVAPASFFGLRPGQWTDIYAPLAARVALDPEESARAQIAALFRNLNAPGDTNADPTKIFDIVSHPGTRGIDTLGNKESTPLWILSMLVDVLLLIVCANVANLLLARSVRRRRESALRLALGAARARLFRQHCIESGTLALLGGGASLLAGYVLAKSLHALFEAGRGADSAFDLHIDLRILGYTAALSIFAALLFGVAPAIRAARAQLNDDLKASSRSLAGAHLRLPRILVSIQIALCLAALVASGLLSRSLANLKMLDIGFDRENLAYVSVNPRQAGYTPVDVWAYAARLREKLTQLPGVAAAGFIQVRPLSGCGNMARVVIQGKPVAFEKGIVSAAQGANINTAGEGAFEALGIPLVLGKFFDARDFHAKANTAIVDERFARNFFPGRNPIGRHFGFGNDRDARYEIVGVVRDSRYRSLRDAPLPVIYEPFAPDVPPYVVNFAIRAHIDSSALQREVRSAVASIDSSVPMTQFRTQDALIDGLLRTERLLGFVSGAFSAFALLLAAIGLGSLLSYMVARRTNEIGVRMAIGASTRHVTTMILRDSLWMVSAGLIIGLPCTWSIGKYLTSVLFGLKPLDPVTTAVSLVTLVAIAFLAAWIPARRAARINPVVALREE